MANEQCLFSAMLEVVVRGRWVDIVRLRPQPGRRTDTYAVVTHEPTIVIAHIRWHGPWFRYAFFPEPGTVWEEGCLRDIGRFLAARTRQQRRPKTGKTLREVFS